jgi:hypothetical protein
MTPAQVTRTVDRLPEQRSTLASRKRDECIEKHVADQAMLKHIQHRDAANICQDATNINYHNP